MQEVDQDNRDINYLFFQFSQVWKVSRKGHNLHNLLLRTGKTWNLQLEKKIMANIDEYSNNILVKSCAEIDAIGIEVAQQIKLSGCPKKGHFTVFKC